MKVSCIIPVWEQNVEWLDRAVGSALNLYDEIIVCCTAGSEFIPVVQNCLIVGCRLVVSYLPSIAYQRNLAIVNATGDYICELDSDDLVDRDGQELVRSFCYKERKMDVVFAMVREFGDGIDNDKPLIWPSSAQVNIPNLFNQNCVPASAWFKKQLWWDLGGFHHVRYDDWHFWKRAKIAGAKFAYAGEFIFYHHRRWSGAVSAQFDYRSDLGHNW